MNNNIISMVLNKVVELQGSLMLFDQSAGRRWGIFKDADKEGFNLLLIGDDDAYIICPDKLDALGSYVKGLSEFKNKFICAYSKKGVRYIKIFVNDKKKEIPVVSQLKKAGEESAESKHDEAVNMTFIKVVVASLDNNDIDNISDFLPSELDFFRYVVFDLAEVNPSGFLKVMSDTLRTYHNSHLNYLVAKASPECDLLRYVHSLRDGAISVLKYACERTGQQVFASAVEKEYKALVAKEAAAAN